MGLAASQARFLGLTARKSNVEYRGQQINQARTALANEISGLYSDYNALEVPVPPAEQDYTKITYTFDAGKDNYEISSFSKITSGENEGYYNATLKKYVETSYVNDCSQNVILSVQEGVTTPYSYLSFQIGTKSYEYYDNDEKNSDITRITGDYTKYTGLSQIMEKYGYKESDNPVFYRLIVDDKEYYVSEKNIQDTNFNEQGQYSGEFGGFYYLDSKTDTKYVNTIAKIEQDDSGRLSTIYIKECEDDKSLEGKAYSISTNSEKDYEKYKDAENQYNYDVAKYEKECDRLNKKTEQLQLEDRSLETELRQCDTEQEALKTEMDAIQKVIQETCDSIFKTYNS